MCSNWQMISAHVLSNVSEQLIEKGLATVLRHKREDEDRSMELDKLIIAEQTCVII